MWHELIADKLMLNHQLVIRGNQHAFELVGDVHLPAAEAQANAHLRTALAPVVKKLIRPAVLGHVKL
ncbi:hypothetical protein HRbin36_02637 [bacterium HR36]|nr:hypothetical protein HRbin36_02637 [bacterium HR36]